VEDGGQPYLFGERFRVHGQAGQGGMSTVYRATDLVSGAEVALKVLSDSTSAERFNQEAALLSELGHPAIVRYVDHGLTAAGERYLAMEWLEGETLDDRLGRGRLGIIESLRLGRRILEGLAVAHRKGIVHRDVKPPNIFLPAGELAQAKLLDFGIARRGQESKRLTSTGAALGTPAYMSPEQVRGSSALGPGSDVFSLASVLFECMTGETLFAGETPLVAMAEIFVERAVSVRDRRSDLPEPVAALLDRMLLKNPTERPGDAAALAVEMGELVTALLAEGMVTGETPVTLANALDAAGASEQRVVSVIVAAPPDQRQREREATGTWDVPTAAAGQQTLLELFDESTVQRIEGVIAPFGGRAELFLGRALAITVDFQGTPSDLAAQAARCALAVRAIAPRICYALGTGRSSGARPGGDQPVRLDPDRQDGVGDLIGETAGLLGGADPGSIRVDLITGGLLEGRFQIGADAADPGRQRLLFEKGIKEAPRTVLGKDIPCVGREREINNLLALWDEARGEPVARAVLVTSPAGGGKSRVRHELIERIQSRGESFQYLIGRGDSVRAGAPYAVLGPAVRGALGLVGGEPAVIQRRRLLNHVERVLPGPGARKVAAFLGEIADIRFPDDDLPQLRAARQDPRLLADQVMAAWLDYVEAECRVHPLLLVFEDLHWGDLPSVQLVDAALRNLGERPLMVLAFARPTIDDRFPGLWKERDLQRVGLSPLTPRNAQRLAQHILGELPADKLGWIVERADGNPFYLEELARAVGNGDQRQGMPDSVLGMVQARFDALGPDAKRVLRAASIFGQSFSASGVRALVGDVDRSLDRWLEILTGKEIVFARPAGDTQEFVFRHALLEEAAHAMLTAEDRTLCHRLAGEFLEEHGEHDAMVLVNHFEQGDRPDRAAHWCRPAAQQALDASDLGAVVERVERGVRLGATGEALGWMRVIEAQARFWRGEYREAEAAATEATDLLTGAGWYAALRELIAAEGQLAKYSEIEARVQQLRRQVPDEAERSSWIEALVRAVCYLLPGGRYEAADRTTRVIEAHSSFHSTAARARLKVAAGIRMWHEGNAGALILHFESVAELDRELGDVRSEAEALANVGSGYFELGQFEKADEVLSAALATSQRLDLRYLMTYCLGALGGVRFHLGQGEAALALAEEGLEMARAQGDRRIEGQIECLVSVCARMAGRLDEAEQRGRVAARALSDVAPALPAAKASLALALLEQGRTGDALESAQGAWDLLNELGGVEESDMTIRLAYAQALTAVSRADEALAVASDACTRLRERAQAIPNPEWRESFLTRVPVNVATLALTRRLSGSSDS
jgi:tetratricopeptide (TPR) repeat protein